MITHVIFDVNTFGITQRSLKMLRNSIAARYTHRIAVIEVPTSNSCCGFLVLDRDERESIWTGDGFRIDGGGEGGAGYRTAQALFNMFRLVSIPWEMVNFEEVYTKPEKEIESWLMSLSQEITDSLEEEKYRRPSESMPNYLRG